MKKAEVTIDVSGSPALVLPPLSLYIHLPWCAKKCPYCDFNSHLAPARQLPEDEYLSALFQDIESALPLMWGRRIHSIFIGGGTPSLFSPAAVDKLLSRLRMLFNLSPKIEITLEANPDSSEVEKFADFKKSGINRLSVGIQSFDAKRLKALGRLHNGAAAKRAADAAVQIFTNVNFDLMHGLPQQSTAMAVRDVEIAASYNPAHLSLYQLTLEPNTPFFKSPPPRLPDADAAAVISQAVTAAAQSKNYQQYEISAYAKAGAACQHNLNYWQFGDYLGVGAGAHSKITQNHRILRCEKIKNPRLYMAAADKVANESHTDGDQAVFDCLLNGLRLVEGVPLSLVHQRAGVPSAKMQKNIEQLVEDGLLADDLQTMQATPQGLQWLNDVLLALLPNPPTANNAGGGRGVMPITAIRKSP